MLNNQLLKWVLKITCMSSMMVAAAAESGLADDARTRAKLLSDVRSWGCQFQNAKKAEIIASSLDLIVLDQDFDGNFLEADDVRKFKRKPDGSRRFVFAYLSVGEAESYRHYWKPEWSSKKPSWIGAPNPNWPNSYYVRYWNKDWQDIVFRGPDSFLERILSAGFDGVFLDRVDAYWDWHRENAVARRQMIELVEDLAEKARRNNPEFLIIGQNAEPLLDIPRYRAAIDAVSKEVLLYSLKAPEAINDRKDVDWSLNYLKIAQRAGLKILTIEYLNDAKKIAAARRRHETLGFTPFFGNRALDRLPGTIEAKALALSQ